jgi:DNA transformation protein and related proteins
MDAAEIEEMFESLGPVAIRRMFGGKGVYHQGLILAVEIRGEMRLKGDAQTAPELEAAGAVRWTYQRTGKAPVAMPYWSVPESAYDDPEEMARCVRLAWEAALRAQAKG